MPTANITLPSVDRNSSWGNVVNTINNNSNIVSTKLSKTTDKIIATNGQTLITLSGYYQMGTDDLEVYRNNVRQWITTGYTETTNQSITLIGSCIVGEVIVVRYSPITMIEE